EAEFLRLWQYAGGRPVCVEGNAARVPVLPQLDGRGPVAAGADESPDAVRLPRYAGACPQPVERNSPHIALLRHQPSAGHRGPAPDKDTERENRKAGRGVLEGSGPIALGRGPVMSPAIARTLTAGRRSEYRRPAAVFFTARKFSRQVWASGPYPTVASMNW